MCECKTRVSAKEASRTPLAPCLTAPAAMRGSKAMEIPRSASQWYEPCVASDGGNDVGSLTVPLMYAGKV